jgi:tetratricopeptide (TPR) repeat protein
MRFFSVKSHLCRCSGSERELEKQEEILDAPVFKSAPLRSSALQPKSRASAPKQSQAKIKSLAVALAVVLTIAVGAIWFAAYKERTVALSSPAAAPTIVPDAEIAYNRGIANYSNTVYGAAISDFTQAIRLQPDYADAYYGRGLAYNNTVEYYKAIGDFTEAIRLRPDYARCLPPSWYRIQTAITT